MIFWFNPTAPHLIGFLFVDVILQKASEAPDQNTHIRNYSENK